LGEEALDDVRHVLNTLDHLRRPGPIPIWSESPLTIMRVLVEAIEHSQDSDDG
jgi:hypothetical protein